jgi:L-alanine-DL-glutamate epimerase-like enolase superfamily enzyme
MKITNVEPVFIAVPYTHGGLKLERVFGPGDRMGTLLVRIDTDAGITGWGESFGLSVSPVTQAALAHILAPLCIGRDPEDLPAIMAHLRRNTRNAGTSGPVRYALSGVEIALWDIAGKIRGAPLHALFGGKKRDRIPTYASFLNYGTAERLEPDLRAAVERGYTHIKLHEHAVDMVAIARRCIGPTIGLMLDTNCAWNLAEAITMARRMEEHDVLWLEEPIFPPTDYAALAELRRNTTIAIAAGENVGNAEEVTRVAAAGALDVFQPDAAKIGGLTEMREAVAIAQAAGMRVQPHSPFFGPAIIATLHVLATMDDAMCERFYCDLEVSVLGDAIDVRDGTMRVPDGPGLGITVDERVIERYRV